MQPRMVDTCAVWATRRPNVASYPPGPARVRYQLGLFFQNPALGMFAWVGRS